ncbi:MAG TPA: prephenate dehydrogenase/arogenate dehydrogenase family protein [Candidatus Lustribacter sp.]
MKGTVLGVAGVGLIGGSIALRAHAAGASVVGYDRDPGALRAAVAAGALDATAPDLATLAERCNVVAIALPVDVTIDVLATTPQLDRAELVFDVASVKLPIVEAARERAHFVASHPLAGRETGGFGAADPALFEGCTWAVTPARDAAAQARLEAFVTALGARPLAIGAEEHDRLVAVSSHLPQLLSVALGAHLAATGDADGRVYELCGPGMRSMLRLAHSDAALWAPIAQANAGAVAEALQAVAAALQATANGLGAGRLDALLAAFEGAHRAVGALEHSAGSTGSLPHPGPKR